MSPAPQGAGDKSLAAPQGAGVKSLAAPKKVFAPANLFDTRP